MNENKEQQNKTDQSIRNTMNSMMNGAKQLGIVKKVDVPWKFINGERTFIMVPKKRGESDR